MTASEASCLPTSVALPAQSLIQVVLVSARPSAAIYSIHELEQLGSVIKAFRCTKDKDKKTMLKADRNVLQHLITAYEAGWPVDLSSVLKHELLPVPFTSRNEW